MTQRTAQPALPDRRQFIKTASATAAGLSTLPLAVGSALAQSPSSSPAADIITRKIPRTGEVLPAIGLGTYLTFDLLPGKPRDNVREVLKRFYEGGGRVVDTSPLYGTGEISVGDFASALGITDQLFIANKIWSTGDFLADESHAQRSFDQSLQRLWRERLDVLQVHSLVNVDQILPMLQNWKREGRVRHVGVTHHEVPYFGALAQVVERAAPDFVQVHYSIQTRLAEERILPAAIDKGVAVLVNMPFEKARLFTLVQGRPLPDFAQELGIANWAQYFLKWVISHPAVTAAIPATSNPAHQSENIGALRGPLPDREMRNRMLRHMEAIPGFDKLHEQPPYPGKTFPGIIRRAQNQRAAAAAK